MLKSGSRPAACQVEPDVSSLRSIRTTSVHHFPGEVIERAQTDPQIITRHGKPSVVIVSAEEWARKTVRKGTLAEFLMASPLRDADLDLQRVRDQPRDIDL